MSRRKHTHGLPSNPGLSPGTLTIPDGAPRPHVRVVRYDTGSIEARDNVGVQELAKLSDDGRILWIDVEGYGDRALFEMLERVYRVPRLALEDVLGNRSRPKLELFGDCAFITSRALKHSGRPEFEQLSLFVRGKTVITFADEPLDLLAPLRKRLHAADSLTRRSGVDFLVYRMLDCVVDTFVPCLEEVGTRLEELEARAIEHPSSKPLRTVYELVRDLRLVARVALPTRELVNALGQEGRALFAPATLPFLADLRDHANGIVEMTAHYRDLGTDVRELIHGALNLKLNQVMRMLTAVTSVFIPLSFVTGLYGMNFDYMPELKLRGGYFIVLALLALIAVFILNWLRKHGWTRIGEDE